MFQCIQIPYTYHRLPESQEAIDAKKEFDMEPYEPSFSDVAMITSMGCGFAQTTTVSICGGEQVLTLVDTGAMVSS